MDKKKSLPNSHWNRDKIRAERLARLRTRVIASEAVLQQIADIETALYPFVMVLQNLGKLSWRGTQATSKLFPMLSEKDKFQIYENGSIVEVDKIPENELHHKEYFEQDSINIEDGAKLDDLFEIISVNQQAPGASVNCGSITMGDVRYAKDLLYPVTPEAPGDDQEAISNLSPPRIVCAANRYKDILIVSARHFDPLMHEQIARLDIKIPSSHWEQGFIDQHRTFYTREEAWVIAEQNGQIREQVSSPGILYSENLY